MCKCGGFAGHNKLFILWMTMGVYTHVVFFISAMCKKVVHYTHPKQRLYQGLSTVYVPNSNLFNGSFAHYPQPLLLKLLSI